MRRSRVAQVVPLYRFFGRHPRVWKFTYHTSRLKVLRWSHNRFTSTMMRPYFRRAIEDAAPDMVVSVHPMCQSAMILSIIKQIRDVDAGHPVPFATIVTDLGTAHPTWFHRDVDALFVPGADVHAVRARGDRWDINGT